MRSGRPVEALERQELLGGDVEVLVMLDQRLDEMAKFTEDDDRVFAVDALKAKGVVVSNGRPF